ncbi:hypothetical protein ACIHCQ_41100 [Streptomyces sp. NPDC052236]|uniref:hypothetical protein n=1 Tax=Streptomyces sp. NPDC052236 TaxID=3365686 RepID=UPI0037D44FD6
MRLDTATDWDTLAADAILDPPFEPPGVELNAAWITRLYRLLGIERALVSRAVAGLLSAENPRLVKGAYHFFCNEREAVGVEEVAGSVAARQKWLTATPDPKRPSSPLLNHAALLLHRRLMVTDENGNPADRTALEVAKELALTGVGPSHTPLTFSDHDPEWLLTHAVGLVRANSRWISMLVYVMARTGSERRKHVLRDIAGVAPERVRQAIEQHFQEPERGELLTFIA